MYARSLFVRERMVAIEGQASSALALMQKYEIKNPPHVSAAVKSLAAKQILNGSSTVKKASFDDPLFAIWLRHEFCPQVDCNEAPKNVLIIADMEGAMGGGRGETPMAVNVATIARESNTTSTKLICALREIFHNIAHPHSFRILDSRKSKPLCVDAYYRTVYRIAC